ncbi:hypothetical protein [Cognatilysobacter terrigena]|nr:hypothetical protein [Lysobacter terrigena]
MTGPNTPAPNDDVRIARARRTALWFGLVAVAVFFGFIAFTALTR